MAIVAAVPPRQKKGSLKEGPPKSQWGKSRERLAWMLVTPAVLIVFGVALWPLVSSLYLSFTNASLTRPDATWVGLRNFERMFNDAVFIQAIKTTVTFTFFSVLFETVFGMIIALTINSSFKGRGLVRTSMLIPWAIPTIVSAQMWAWMYNDVFGVFNDILTRRACIGGHCVLDNPIAWISPSYEHALWSIIAIDIWKTTPFMTLLILAGLQIIPGDVYEAATVDGASKWQQFWQITMPLVRPALVVALIFRTLDAFRVFDVIQVTMAYATRTMSLAVYAQQNFSKNRSGFGMTSASSVFILLVVMSLVVIYTKLIKVEEV